MVMRVLFLLVVPVLIAAQDLQAKTEAAWALPGMGDTPEAPTTEGAAPAGAHKEEATAPPPAHQGPVVNALQAFKSNLWSLITVKDYQCIVAIFALELGLVALYDGRSFFKVLVVLCVAALVFCMVLSQLRTTWVEGESTVMKYVASLEVGLFIGLCAYKGWEGTQLLLGLFAGMYIFSNVQAVAMITPYVQKLAVHSAWVVTVGPLAVAVGAWMTHERFGGGRVFGILAPLFGSTLVVATAAYGFMLLCTVQGVGVALNVSVAPSAVPSVFEFWYMIVSPMHSEAVGYFHMAHKNIVLGGTPIELDRVLSIFFSIVIFFVSTKFQLKADRAERSPAKVDTLSDPLLVDVPKKLPMSMP